MHNDNKNFYASNGSLYDKNGIQLFDFENHKISKIFIDNNSNNQNCENDPNFIYRSFAIICTKDI